ncbi:CoA-transferase family III domain-containing protein [Aspergillus bertholletiae]|uniref:CoA-transferase family III domain-containing protein n=1 Tax=Aspergillus bertholletiae TaxID=1226010 RepID=A0A5N7B8V8_9EURO|nr:CoA-transferase family III domain-containing protein [Aspergillus bertholletiae]
MPPCRRLSYLGLAKYRTSGSPRISTRFSHTAPNRQDQSDGALKGVKVLDLSRVLAAPYCTQILADYGAEVTKIEEVDKGDDTRHWKVDGEEQAWTDESLPFSLYYASVNRNKRSMCLDLKHDKGKEIFLQLAKEADIVIENFRPGKMEQLGLGYETLQKANPRLIYATVSGYGAGGPSAERSGYDMIAAAEAGLLHVTGERDGPPVRPGLGLVDMSTGLYIHGAILAALHARQRTGLGQRVDASLFETQIALLINVGLAWLNLEQESERWGCQHPSVVPYDAFKTKDLYIICGATNDRQFSKLMEILGSPSLAQDERFRTNALRVKNRDALFPMLRELFEKRTTNEWLDAFEGSALPYAPINNMSRVFSHPQTLARDMIATVPFEGSAGGTLNLIGPAVKFSLNKPSIRSRPPLLGENTDDILKGLGYTEQDILSLKETKIV